MLLAGGELVFLGSESRRPSCNSAADIAAKAALVLPISNLALPHTDHSPLIRTYVLSQWQDSWSLETQNKLYAVEPTVNIAKSYRLPLWDEIIVH
jgi:hypothetical protein